MISSTLRIKETLHNSNTFHHAANRLRELGFEVLSEGRTSVTVKAPLEKYKVLGIEEIVPNKSFNDFIEPTDASLATMIDRIEISGLTMYSL